LAKAIQASLLPTLPTRLPGLEIAARYHPARSGVDVGGDWYDAFETPYGTVALEIGDVQGHDVGAATWMGQVRTAFRAFATRESEPAAVLSWVNELLINLQAPRFASCVMLYFNPQDTQMTGANAGHVPVLWARTDGSYGTQELPADPLCGVLGDITYDQRALEFGEDTVLILVTDGAVEGPGLTLDDGVERLGAIAGRAMSEGLSLNQIVDRVLDAASAVDHLDDVAVLAVRQSSS
jgi:serine phosphatase RsbU (regulator of sigma subunit)